MPKISDEDISRVLCRLWAKDYKAIKSMATTEVTAAQIIRDAIHQFVLAADARARRTIDSQRRPSIEELEAILNSPERGGKFTINPDGSISSLVEET